MRNPLGLEPRKMNGKRDGWVWLELVSEGPPVPSLDHSVGLRNRRMTDSARGEDVPRGYLGTKCWLGWSWQREPSAGGTLLSWSSDLLWEWSHLRAVGTFLGPGDTGQQYRRDSYSRGAFILVREDRQKQQVDTNMSTFSNLKHRVASESFQSNAPGETGEDFPRVSPTSLSFTAKCL